MVGAGFVRVHYSHVFARLSLPVRVRTITHFRAIHTTSTSGMRLNINLGVANIDARPCAPPPPSLTAHDNTDHDIIFIPHHRPKTIINYRSLQWDWEMTGLRVGLRVVGVAV